MPFKCSSCGYRTPYDNKSGIWYPYLHHGTNYKTWFVAKCNNCGEKSKLKGILWLALGGVIIGAASIVIVNNSGSIESLILLTSAQIIFGIVFVLALVFFTIRWIPYDK
jgi:hypothetical protein